jgi:endonuclease/exonuclease/phosphatase (EEP) superfamily protein YafD
MQALRGSGPGWVSALAWLMLLYGLGAGILVGLGRWRGDSTWWLFIANLSVFYWLAPTVVFAFGALLRRWWPVAAVCLVGAVIWLGTFGPLFVPQRAADIDTLRIATYNVSPQARVAHVARLVDRTRPDVLLAQEVLPGVQDALVTALPSLPYHHFATVNAWAPGGGGTAVLSRFPIVRIQPVEGLPRASRPTDLVSLDTGDGVVTVVSLHLNSPCGQCRGRDGLDGRMRALERDAQARQIEIERIAAALPAGPLVVGGDLNSSTFNVPRRRLLSVGLTDLHRAIGAGPGFTRFRSHGLVRIDWLLASKDIVPVREWVERRDGSEHRPVLADVGLPRPSH